MAWWFSTGRLRLRYLCKSMKSIKIGNNGSVIIDEMDEPVVSGFHWNKVKSKKNFYAVAHVNVNGKRTTTSMHRVILGAKKGQQVDHISGDGLDNRRKNLRFVTQSENTKNSRKRQDSVSDFYGVTFEKHAKKWRARHVVGNQRFSLGMFKEELEAAKAYDKFVKDHDPFARRNFART